MVLNYSVNLYFPQDQCGAVLRSVAALADENDADVVELRTVCQLPDGSLIHLPFTSERESKPVEIHHQSPPLLLETILLFPIDSFLEVYIDAGDSQKSREGTRAFAAYLDLTISLDNNFCEFSFEAYTSDMSHVLVASPSVRGGFNNLLEAHNGLFGLIDTEDYGITTLYWMNSMKTLPLHRFAYIGNKDFNIDGFVGEVRSIEESRGTETSLGFKTMHDYCAPILSNAHPGEILAEEFMRPLGVSGYQLAHETGMTEGHISQIVRGCRSITAETALRLGTYFGTTAQFWMHLQSAYALREAQAAIGESLREITTHPRARVQ